MEQLYSWLKIKKSFQNDTTTRIHKKRVIIYKYEGNLARNPTPPPHPVRHPIDQITFLKGSPVRCNHPVVLLHCCKATPFRPPSRAPVSRATLLLCVRLIESSSRHLSRSPPANKIIIIIYYSNNRGSGSSV